MNFRGGPVEVDRLPRVAARGGCCLNGLPASPPVLHRLNVTGFSRNYFAALQRHKGNTIKIARIYALF